MDRIGGRFGGFAVVARRTWSYTYQLRYSDDVFCYIVMRIRLLRRVFGNLRGCEILLLADRVLEYLRVRIPR